MSGNSAKKNNNNNQNNKNKFSNNWKNKRCFNCGQLGHIANACKKKDQKPEEAAHNYDYDSDDVSLVCCLIADTDQNKTWIADTGASLHMCVSLDKLVNV